MEKTKISEIICPKCGNCTYEAQSALKGLYVCVTKTEKGITCDHMQCYCKNCKTIRDETEFGKHGDVWECKECGSVCWPITDRMRAKEQAEALLKQTDGFLSSLYKW